MARQIIDTTTPQPGGKMGDTAKVAFEKTNGNFEELYDAVANIPEDTTGDIEALDTRVTANEGAISALDTRVTANEGAVATLQSDAAGVEAAFLSGLHGYINGFIMEWLSNTSIRVSGGAAYVPGAGGIVHSASAIASGTLSLSPSTWYHVYLYRDGNGDPQIELSTTGPDVPYFGMARTKTGDGTRRYLGSVLTDASANIYNFQHQIGGIVVMRCPTGSGTPFRVVSGSATSYTLVSCAAVVPPTCRMALMKLAAPNGAVLRTTVPGASNTPGPPSFNSIFAVPAGVEQYVTHPLSENLQMAYWCDSGTPSGNAGVYVYGYLYER